MADPLSIGASLLAVVAAAIQSSKSLCATVRRYQGRDKTLARLYHELEDLVNILSSLEEAIDADTAVMALLEKPVDRCNQVCTDLKTAMEKFRGKSSIGLIDWARMEFMASDINEFIDTLAGYKSTITIGVGTITMKQSKLNQQVVEEYSEMIKDTAYNLEIHLQRIDERLAQISQDSTAGLDTSVDLKSEKDVTKQCLQICENAWSYMESLQTKQPSLLRSGTSATAGSVHAQFEAQLLTSQTLKESQDKMVETIKRLQEQLSIIISSKDPQIDRERARLLEDLNVSKSCLEVCEQASKQVSHQKIHTFGEVVADDDTDQVVVTTLADLFDVRKVLAKSRSVQLVGSMTDDSLQKLCAERYGSRFCVPNGGLGNVHIDVASPSILETRDSNIRTPDQIRRGRYPTDLKGERPSPNEMRKRTGGSDNGS